jgi:cytochrome c oxidase subunit II
MLDLLGLPVAASAHAGQLDQILVITHWLMLVLFVGWGAFFTYVLIRFRRTKSPRADHRGVQGGWSSWVEGGVLVAEVALLAFFSVPAWSNRVDDLPEESRATLVRVVAEQFAWNVHYPGKDGTFGRTDITLVGPDNPLGLDDADDAARDDIITDRLNMPVNKPVLVMLSSKDVVHSFGLPQMRVKQDAVPGLVQPVWFTPTVTGTWDIACSQLCGLGHYRMKSPYQVMSQADYDAWLAEESALLGIQ